MHDLAVASQSITTPVPTRDHRWDGAVAVLPVALLAAASLYWPEAPDQQLFVQAAQQLNEGGAYYRDVWDIKQPGLYWLYQLGELVAPHGFGTRLIEVALAVAAAVLVRVLATRWGLSRGARLAAPALVLAPYLLYSALLGVGQIEGLMNALLVAVLAGTWPRREGPTPVWAWFLAGLAVGAVGLLKTIYLPIVLVPAAVALVRSRRRWPRAGAGLLGTALPALAGLAYLTGNGVLDLAWWTSVDLPPQVARATAGENAGFAWQPVRAVLYLTPLAGPLALIGLVTARRHRRLVLALTLTATVAVMVPLALSQLWTPYRWLMFSAPIGLVAALGLDAVLSRRPSGAWRAVLVAVAVVLTLPTFRWAAEVPRTGGLGLDARIARGENLDPVTHPHAMAALVAGKVRPGEPVLMMGDPRILSLLGARSATPVSGWVVQPLPERMWDRFTHEFDVARPRFAFVDPRDWNPGGTGWSAGVFERLDRDYRVIARTPDGTWYERR